MAEVKRKTRRKEAIVQISGVTIYKSGESTTRELLNL